MKSATVYVALSLAAALMTFTAGCGDAGSNEKVDVKAQIQNLSSSNTEDRVNACVELAKAGPDAAPAVQPLIGALKDSDPLVRRLAAYALGQIGPAAKEALPALKPLLNDSDREVVTATVNAIRAIDPAAPVQAVPNVSN